MYYFISYMLVYVLNTQSTIQLSIADFAIVVKDGLFSISIVTSPQLLCDVTLAWLFLHDQIGTKAIFASE